MDRFPINPRSGHRPAIRRIKDRYGNVSGHKTSLQRIKRLVEYGLPWDRAVKMNGVIGFYTSGFFGAGLIKRYWIDGIDETKPDLGSFDRDSEYFKNDPSWQKLFPENGAWDSVFNPVTTYSMGGAKFSSYGEFAQLMEDFIDWRVEFEGSFSAYIPIWRGVQGPDYSFTLKKWKNYAEYLLNLQIGEEMTIDSTASCTSRKVRAMGSAENSILMKFVNGIRRSASIADLSSVVNESEVWIGRGTKVKLLEKEYRTTNVRGVHAKRYILTFKEVTKT